MTDRIVFGTDGWRAVIGDAFTFDNVRLVSGAIAVAARAMNVPETVDRDTLVVGFDRRFLSAEFARVAAGVLGDAGYNVLLSDSPVPSPAVSHAVARRHALGGVVITASHNPAAYNGIKFKGWYGGSALPAMYAAIIDALGQREMREGGRVTETDILSPYVDELRSRVDVAAIRSAGTSILHDPIHGVAAGVVERVLEIEGAGNTPLVSTVRGEENPGFGGVNPEPIEENLEVSQRAMRGGGYDLAICNDGDADRLGVLDENGDFVNPHRILALLTVEMIRGRNLRGGVVKTFSTSRLMETVAKRLGVPLHETPIGFKYVADLMLERDIVIGGEESGGIGLGSFLPERDGILSGLLVAEAVARSGKPLSKLVDDMEEEFGRFHYGRRDVRHTEDATRRLIERARAGDLDPLFGRAVASREETDGVKLNFDNGAWILLRLSGTESMLRIYVESPDASDVQLMLDRAVEELGRPV